MSSPFELAKSNRQQNEPDASRQQNERIKPNLMIKWAKWFASEEQSKFKLHAVSLTMLCQQMHLVASSAIKSHPANFAT